jgi:gamma-D-glutamyl-L-lysine dipeptidyl-peptidase
MTRLVTVVDMATVWTSPEAPREVDEPAVRDAPDPTAWVKALDAETRLGLHGRTLTQLLRHEPVDVIGHGPPGWLEVAAPWQPAPEHDDGYHGWIRSAHVAEAGEAADDSPFRPSGPVPADRVAVLAEAATHLGLQYLWGGMSPWGLDCSGLVHHAYRRAGVVVPRDAYAQHAAATPVPLGEEQPGDLYFFAREDGRVFHVGFVTGRFRMLHAPETKGGGLIEDVELPEERRARLLSAGRFLA